MRKKEFMKISAVALSVLITGAGTGGYISAQDFSDTEKVWEAEGDITPELSEDEISGEAEEPEDSFNGESEESEDGEDLQMEAPDFADLLEAEMTDGEKTASEEAVTEKNDTEENNSEITGIQGQLYSNSEGQSFCSEYRTGEITERTTEYEGQTWKVISLNFETDDFGKNARQAWIRLKFTAEDQSRITIGRMYYKANDTASGFLEYKAEKDSWDGGIALMTMPLSTGSNPMRVNADLYCIYKGENGNTHYLIRIVRKGSSGIQREPYYGESNPLPVKFVYNEETGGFEADENEAEYAMKQEQGIRTYNSDGIPNGFLKWNPCSFEGREDFYIKDEIFYAKNVGQYPLYIASYDGKEYQIPVRVTYNIKVASKLLEQLKTDGITALDKFSDEDSFSAAFPEKYQEQARAFFREEKKLQTVLDNTCGDGKYEEDWDHALYENVWSDDCESVKLDQLKAEAPEIWKNIFGIPDAKEKIKNAADLDHASSVYKTELEGIVKNSEEKLDSWYQQGKIKNIQTVNKLVEETVNSVYRIKGLSLDACTCTPQYTAAVYDGKEKKPSVTVRDKDNNRISAEFYQVRYQNNRNAGTAEMIITGKGMCKGEKKISYKIQKAPQKIKTQSLSYEKTEGSGSFLLKASVSSGNNLTFSSSNTKVAGVDSKGKVTVKGIGTATIMVTVPGSKNYEKGTAKVTVRVVPKLVKISSTSIVKTEDVKTFQGCSLRSSAVLTTKSSAPNVAVMDKKGKVTIKGPGRAVITILAEAKGVKQQKYSLSVNVKPSSRLSVTAVSPKKGKVTVTWKKNSKASGYQVVLSYDASFRNKIKVQTIRNSKTGSAVFSGLKAGKTCYVRVRSFKKTSSGTLYGNWSKKTVKIKS